MLILNVDDDIDDREMFCDALKAIDPEISCMQVESGLKAVEFLRKNEVPDFIFVDINMPKMNGYECVEEIRSISHLRKVPIIMYSTTFNPNDQVNFTNLGIQYLIKSSRFAEVVSAIKKMIYKLVTQPEERSKT